MSSQRVREEMISGSWWLAKIYSILTGFASVERELKTEGKISIPPGSVIINFSFLTITYSFVSIR
jgi:hypothetical protein